MIVRAVQIDQLIPEILENAERGGRAVDKLAIRPGRGKTALHDQLDLVALHSGFVEQRMELLEFGPFENRFDRARFRPGPDQRFVGPLAEEKLERADDDRLAGARLTGDGGKARRQLPLKVLHQRQVFYPQKTERGGHFERLKVEG